MTTMTKSEFDKNLSLAENTANNNPVFITENGKTSYVLLNYEDYLMLSGKKDIIDMLSCDEASDIDFEPERLNINLRPVEF